MNVHKLASRKGCTLLKVVIILFLFLIITDGNECFRRVYHSISMTTYRRTSQTVEYRCGLFGWSRCRRIIYRQTSILQYVSTVQPVCCEGYTLNTDKNGCLPICRDECIHPMTCVAPNTCECPGGYRGADCTIPICDDCSHQGQQCVAPNQCECFNGTDCTSESEHSQNVTTGGYHTSSTHATTPASSVNRETVIAGTSVAVLLLLLLVSIIVVVLIVYGISKKKKCAKDVSASVSDHHSTQNDEVYNITYHHGVDRPCHGGVDNPNYASAETDLQYDSLRFETNTESGTKTKTEQESNFESEYSQLSH